MYTGRNEDPNKERSEPSVFGLNIKGIRQRGRRRSPAEERSGAQVGAARRMDPLIMALERTVREAEKEAERAAMHGPVRVLWKDGKPC